VSFTLNILILFSLIFSYSLVLREPEYLHFLMKMLGALHLVRKHLGVRFPDEPGDLSPRYSGPVLRFSGGRTYLHFHMKMVEDQHISIDRN
jgi:hypothetical protein